MNPSGSDQKFIGERLLRPLVYRLSDEAKKYDEKRRETREAEERDEADYGWTWNFYEGKAAAYRDAASALLDVIDDPKPREPQASDPQKEAA